MINSLPSLDLHGEYRESALILTNEFIDEIFESWMQKNKTLSLYLEHNELEKVNLSLKMIKGFIEIDIIDESVPEIENCKAILDHIEEKQDFNIKNIF